MLGGKSFVAAALVLILLNVGVVCHGGKTSPFIRKGKEDR